MDLSSGFYHQHYSSQIVEVSASAVDGFIDADEAVLVIELDPRTYLRRRFAMFWCEVLGEGFHETAV